MRFLLAFTLVLALAGCASPPVLSGPPVHGELPGTLSPASTTTVLLQEDIIILGPYSMQFNITVPSGTTALSYQLAALVSAYPFGFKVVITGCGTDTVPNFGGNLGVGTVTGGTVCFDPDTGAQTVTLSTTAAVAAPATFTVYASS